MQNTTKIIASKQYTLYVLVCFFMMLSCKDNQNNSNMPPADLGAPIETINFPSKYKSQTPYLYSTQDNLYLSWQDTENDTLYNLKYTKLEDDSFIASNVITSGTNWFVNWADYPLFSEYNGNMLANTLQKSASGTYTYDIMLSLKPKDSSWSKPFKLHNDTIPAEHGFVSMLPFNKTQFFVTWLDGRQTVNVKEKDRAMNLRGAFVDTQGNITQDIVLDNKICDCCQTTAAMTAKGPVVIYRDRSNEEVRDMSITRYVNNTWTLPQTIYKDNWVINGCPVNGPKTDAINNTLAVAWFTAPNESSKVNVMFSTDNGQTFNMPIQVDLGNPLGRVDIVLLDETKALVSWLENDNILARTITLRGDMGKVITVSKTSKRRASGFPQMALHNKNVYFAWTAVDSTKDTTIKVGKISIKNIE